MKVRKPFPPPLARQLGLNLLNLEGVKSTYKNNMTENEFFAIIDHIVHQGGLLLERYIKDDGLSLDYVAIFSQDEEEQKQLLEIAHKLGSVVEETKTGLTFLLSQPYKTKKGNLRLVKIRYWDKNKPFRGAPDFRVNDYTSFKEKYGRLPNMNLIDRKEYEMLELSDKNSDILVYFPSEPLTVAFSKCQRPNNLKALGAEFS